MDDKTKFKYAIVRVRESSVVDFFGLIASNGYSDVSFVSNLNQAIARPDPNDDGTIASTSQRNDDRIADSEDRCSVVATPASPGEEFSNGTGKRSISNPFGMLLTTPKVEREAEPMVEDEDNNEMSQLNQSAPIDLVNGLFATHKIPLTPSEWSSDLKSTRQYLSQQHRLSPYKQLEGFQTRMKGWQREYIKDVIKEGHYPSEEELRDIEVKCDLSRKQVLRFIAKRVGNPNRRPRDGRLPPPTPEEVEEGLKKLSGAQR
uniref:Homeobox domain-containing protein n=1 Tax=Heterorhabditis bacteriophora TaxID=37862 RepID=A0A1I7XA05_HETBA